MSSDMLTSLLSQDPSFCKWLLTKIGEKIIKKGHQQFDNEKLNPIPLLL